MKKAAATETIQTARDDRDARIEALESRLAKLDPQPPIEMMEPYAIGSQVYSIQDAEGSYPLVVVGYETQRGRRILVTAPGELEPRSLPLVSVVPLEKCAAVKSERVVAPIADEAARNFFEGRRAARMPKPEPPRAARQPKYIPIPD